MDIGFIFPILILVFSVVIHEVAHGYAALMQGDVTAKYAGRLTLNPIKHLDPIGSVILPLVLSLIPGGIIFGWAKPVPYNPNNLRNQRWGEVFVAFMGPASNLIIAFVFSMLIRFADILSLGSAFVQISLYVVLINLFLAIFNLMPIPPLDGSKILFGTFPQKTLKIRTFFDKYGILPFIIFIFIFWNYIGSFFASMVSIIIFYLTGLKI